MGACRPGWEGVTRRPWVYRVPGWQTHVAGPRTRRAQSCGGDPGTTGYHPARPLPPPPPPAPFLPGHPPKQALTPEKTQETRLHKPPRPGLPPCIPFAFFSWPCILHLYFLIFIYFFIYTHIFNGSSICIPEGSHPGTAPGRMAAAAGPQWGQGSGHGGGWGGVQGRCQGSPLRGADSLGLQTQQRSSRTARGADF